MRRRRKRVPRAIKVYDVEYHFYAGEFTTMHFKLRCPKLTPAQLSATHKPLIGEVAHRHNSKWSAFAYGALPDCDAYMVRYIREIVEPTPMALAVDNGGK